MANKNFEIFEDRTRSLLNRWSKFAKEHPDIPQDEIVTSCLAEINDDYTKALQEPG